MRYVKWAFWAILVIVVGGYLHYTLPRNDVVRLVETEVSRVQIDSGSIFWASSEPSDASGISRDVKFIRAISRSDSPEVYRNEDTGWGWPPYFKFNSADLQARAADLVSTKAAPQWVAVKKYGWRNQFLSIYPNVLKIRAVAGPDVRIVPWTSIVVLVLLAIGVFLIWRLMRRFYRNRVDPVVADVASAFDVAEDKAQAAQKEFRGRRQRFREWWVETFG